MRKEVPLLGNPRSKRTGTIAIRIVHLIGRWEGNFNVNIFTLALSHKMPSLFSSFSLNPPGLVDSWIHFTESYIFYSVPGLVLSRPPGTFLKLSCAWHWCWSEPVSHQRTRQHLWLQYRKSTRQRTTRRFRGGTHPLGAKYVRQRAQLRWPSGKPLGTCARRVPVGGCWDLQCLFNEGN